MFAMTLTLMIMLPGPVQRELPAIDRGSNLFSTCKALVRILDSAPQKDDATAANYCMGFIDGYVAGADTRRVVCAEGAARATLARVYVAYMEKNPRLLDGEKYAGLLLALAEAYPCKSRGTNR